MHKKVICKLCDKQISNCRCCTNGPKQTKEIICDSCQKIVDKAIGIKMHHKYPNGIAFYDLPPLVTNAISQNKDANKILDALFEWLDDKFWVCHKIGAEEEKKKH